MPKKKKHILITKETRLVVRTLTEAERESSLVSIAGEDKGVTEQSNLIEVESLSTSEVLDVVMRHTSTAESFYLHAVSLLAKAMNTKPNTVLEFLRLLREASHLNLPPIAPTDPEDEDLPF